MPNIEFAENTLIKWLDRETPYYWRLSTIFEDFAYAIDTNVKFADWPTRQSIPDIQSAIEEGKAQVEEQYDPCADIRALVPKDEADRKMLDRYWIVFKPYARDIRLYNDRARSYIIKEISEILGLKPKKVRTLLRRLLKTGFIKSALLDYYFNCGGRGKKRAQTSEGNRLGNFRKQDKAHKEAIHNGEIKKSGIPKTSEVERHFDIGLAFYYGKRKKRPRVRLRAIWRWIIAKFYFERKETREDGTEVSIPLTKNEQPSWEQFYEYYCTKDPEEFQRALWGDSYVDANERPLLGVVQDFATEPGLVDIIDSTILDVYLRSVINRNWVLSRPRLYIVVDGNCGFIRAVYLTLEEDSLATNLMVLEQAYTSHIDFCARYGHTITNADWPYYIGRILVADRAPPLLSMPTDDIFPNLGAEIDNTAVYRGDPKGYGEKILDIIRSEVLAHIPGYVPKYRVRDDPKPQHLSRYTLDELYRIVIKLVLEFNKRPLPNYHYTKKMLEDGVDFSPLEIVSWQNRKSQLRKETRSVVHSKLLMTSTATVTKRGILWQGKLRYRCNFAEEHNWFYKAGYSGVWTVDILFHPNYPEVIYLKPDRDLGLDQMEACYLIESADMDLYRGASLADFRREREEVNARAQTNEQRILQSRIEVAATIEHTNGQVEKLYQGSRDGTSKSASVKDMDQHTSMERDLRREAERWSEFSTPDSEPSSSPIEDSDAGDPIEQAITSTTSNIIRNIWDNKRKEL